MFQIQQLYDVDRRDYATIYNLVISALGNRCQAIIAVLEQLEDNLRESAAEKEIKKRAGDFFKNQELKFNSKIKDKNEQITAIVTLIKSLENRRGDIEEDDFKKEIKNAFGAELDDLPIPPKTKAIFNFLILQLANRDFNARQSVTIEPSPQAVILEKALPYKDRQQWNVDLTKIILKKKLSVHLFERKIGSKHLTLNSDFADHAAWAFKNIYNYKYPSADELPEARGSGIKRYIHGIMHVSRAATYIPVFANLYRKHGDQDAINLSDSDVKLLQIAALFHDSAREDENEDRWDHESALFLYNYLTNILQVEKSKAKMIAEATANKDPSPNGYFEILEKDNGEVSWQFNKTTYQNGIPPKNIYQKIMHDADCLDIIRARPHFDATYLDFYKNMVKVKYDDLMRQERILDEIVKELEEKAKKFKDQHPLGSFKQFAKTDVEYNQMLKEYKQTKKEYKQTMKEYKQVLNEMATLVTEARSLIATQGDTYQNTNPRIKQIYENKDCYNHIQNDIHKNKYKILGQLSEKLLSVDDLSKTKLIDNEPYDKKKGLTVENLIRAINEGLVFTRGIADPSAKPYDRKGEKRRKLLREEGPETVVGVESRKTFRTEEFNPDSVSDKSSKNKKEGNPFRSVSMIGYGSGVFCNAGFLIVNPDIKAISDIFVVDSATGRGKKKHLEGKQRPSETKITLDLDELRTKLKIGGSTTTFGGLSSHASTHVEILYDIKQYDAIYFSKDPNLYNLDAHGYPDAAHSLSPILQSIFIRNAHEIKYNRIKELYMQEFGKILDPVEANKKFEARFGKNGKLPIFEYSGIHNSVRQVNEEELSDKNIVKMWVSMCSDYIKKELTKIHGKNISKMSLDDIKIYSAYDTKFNLYAAENGPLDGNYSRKLKKRINEEIEKIKHELIENHENALIKAIEEGKILNDEGKILNDKGFFNIFRSSINWEKNSRLKNQIRDAIETTLKDPKVFEIKDPKVLPEKSTNESPKESTVRHYFSQNNLEVNYTDNIYYSFPTNIDEIFKNDDEKNIHIKRILFNSTEMRLYALAKKLDLVDILSEIKRKAGNIAEAEIASLASPDKIINLNEFNKRIIFISKFIQLFDLNIEIPSITNYHKTLVDNFNDSATKLDRPTEVVKAQEIIYKKLYQEMQTASQEYQAAKETKDPDLKAKKKKFLSDIEGPYFKFTNAYNMQKKELQDCTDKYFDNLKIYQNFLDNLIKLGALPKELRSQAEKIYNKMKENNDSEQSLISLLNFSIILQKTQIEPESILTSWFNLPENKDKKISLGTELYSTFINLIMSGNNKVFAILIQKLTIPLKEEGGNKRIDLSAWLRLMKDLQKTLKFHGKELSNEQYDIAKEHWHEEICKPYFIDLQQKLKEKNETMVAKLLIDDLNIVLKIDYLSFGLPDEIIELFDDLLLKIVDNQPLIDQFPKERIEDIKRIHKNLGLSPNKAIQILDQRLEVLAAEENAKSKQNQPDKMKLM